MNYKKYMKNLGITLESLKEFPINPNTFDIYKLHEPHYSWPVNGFKSTYHWVEKNEHRSYTMTTGGAECLCNHVPGPLVFIQCDDCREMFQNCVLITSKKSDWQAVCHVCRYNRYLAGRINPVKILERRVVIRV